MFFFCCLICFLSTGCQHRLYPFPDEGLLCALMCVHLIFCVQTKMFFIDYASEEDKNSVTLENLRRRFVCARLSCRKCTLTKFFSPQSVLYLGDSVEVLEKYWGFFPPPPPRGYSGSLWWKVGLKSSMQRSFPLFALGAWGDHKNIN